MKTMTFFLITTDHLETRLWFRDDEDFKAGMNLVAAVAFSVGVRVVAFILMSNHVHFVLECTAEEAMAFLTEFKRVYSWYLNHRYGTKELLRRNGTDIQELHLGDGSLERAIAYVQMNSVSANLCTHPEAYPWGTGPVFFQLIPRKGKALCTMSARARLRLLHTKTALPPGWLVGEDGYILPECFACVKFVESLYGSPKRMNVFLQNSSKAKCAMSRLDMNLPSFRDQTIVAALPDLCQSLFRERSVQALNLEQRAALCDQIRRRFCADVNQIARVTGIAYEEVVRMLEAF